MRDRMSEEMIAMLGEAEDEVRAEEEAVARVAEALATPREAAVTTTVGVRPLRMASIFLTPLPSRLCKTQDSKRAQQLI